MSIENPTLAHFRHFSSLFTNLPAYKAADIYVPIRHYICREPSTNHLLFMQNKPNLLDAQMNVSNIITMNYKNFIPLAGQKNKPNLVRPALFAKELPDWSNPIRQACVVCEGVAGLIKANFQKAQMNVNLYVIEDYRKKNDFLVRINKPNFQNGQNERKLNFNKGLQKKRCFRSPKNKPKKNPIFSKAKIPCRKIWPKFLIVGAYAMGAYSQIISVYNLIIFHS